ncbi:MAG: phage integrase N-terminal SAM-like domain-containing protein [Pseudomonadota bacterium]
MPCTGRRWPRPTHCHTASAPPPKLLDQVRDRVRRLGYAKRTGQSYVHSIKRYILFHGKRHSRKMGAIGQDRAATLI